MKYEARFFHDCEQIYRERTAFLEGLRAEAREYDEKLRTLRGEDLTVMQGRAQEINRILDLLEDATNVVRRMR